MFNIKLNSKWTWHFNLNIYESQSHASARSITSKTFSGRHPLKTIFPAARAQKNYFIVFASHGRFSTTQKWSLKARVGSRIVYCQEPTRYRKQCFLKPVNILIMKPWLIPVRLQGNQHSRHGRRGLWGAVVRYSWSIKVSKLW